MINRYVASKQFARKALKLIGEHGITGLPMKKKDLEELKAACRDLVDVAKGRKTAEEVGAIVTRPGEPVAPLIRAGLGMTQVREQTGQTSNSTRKDGCWAAET